MKRLTSALFGLLSLGLISVAMPGLAQAENTNNTPLLGDLEHNLDRLHPHLRRISHRRLGRLRGRGLRRRLDNDHLFNGRTRWPWGYTPGGRTPSWSNRRASAAISPETRATVQMFSTSLFA